MSSAAPTKTQPPMTGKQKWGAFFVVAGLLWIVGKACGATDYSSPGNTSAGGYNAESVCEGSVKQQLKAPSTASFSGEEATGGPTDYTVTGNVDAENSFGAKLRSTWTCSASHDGDNWTGSATLNDGSSYGSNDTGYGY